MLYCLLNIGKKENQEARFHKFDGGELKTIVQEAFEWFSTVNT